MSAVGGMLSSMASFAVNSMLFSSGGSSSGRRSRSRPKQQRQNSIELTPMSTAMSASAKPPRTELSDMSLHRKGAIASPGLSETLQKGYDAFSANKEAYKSTVDSGSTKKSFFSDKSLAPMRRNFSDNPDRAARQEAFVNKYMPHVKLFSAFQSGIEKMARGMLGIPDKPKKAGVTENHWQDLSKVERKAAHHHGGFDSQERARQARHMDFLKQHVPILSPLVSMQKGLEKSFQKILGLPTKTPEQPVMGQKIDPTQTANTEEKTQKSPLERNFSNDPERAARQKEFINKYMPHVAALSKLQSSMENAVRNAIKGPTDSSTGEKAGVGATQ